MGFGRELRDDSWLLPLSPDLVRAGGIAAGIKEATPEVKFRVIYDGLGANALVAGERRVQLHARLDKQEFSVIVFEQGKAAGRFEDVNMQAAIRLVRRWLVDRVGVKALV